MENYSDIVFSPNDKEWTKRRKLVHKLLHSYGEGIQLLEDEVLEKLKIVKRYVAENKNKDLDPNDVVAEFLFENLTSVVIIFFIGKCFFKIKIIYFSLFHNHI